jgi:2-polyprenyl-3-methyl-5-hydroxy-6-metoxy-1,4-benzoquinol methylase
MAQKHFIEQSDYTKNYLLPYFQKNIHEFHSKKILEIGCAEGGLLFYLQSLGMDATGVEINKERINIAKEKNPSINILCGDITDPNLTNIIQNRYDVIIMREVIEHINEKEIAFTNIDKLINENGYLFISFPPKYSPFAGHQQIAKSILKVIPYLHLLPENILKPLAKKLNEKSDYVDEIKLHYSTGMIIDKFEKLFRHNNFSIVKKELFIFRPIYGYRYGLPKLRFPDIKYLKEIFTFGYEILLKK